MWAESECYLSHAALSSSYVVHARDPVYDLAWLQSKTGSEAMTVSSDGKALWWDTRRLAEPTDELRLAEKGSEQACGAVCLDYSPAAGPTKCGACMHAWHRSGLHPLACMHRSAAQHSQHAWRCPGAACSPQFSCIASVNVSVTGSAPSHWVLAVGISWNCK